MRRTDASGDAAAPMALPMVRSLLTRTSDEIASTEAGRVHSVPAMEVSKCFSARGAALGFDGPFDLLGGDRLGSDGVAFRLAMDWHPGLMRHVAAVCGDQRVQGRSWFRMPPTLLAGPDGVGRTHIGRRIATEAGLPHVTLDLHDARLVRREASPDVPEPVPPLVAMAMTRCANPVVSVINADTAPPPALALVTRLVDPALNRRIVVDALSTQLDLGQVTWLIQSSAPDRLPDRLCDRLVRIDLQVPDGEAIEFMTIDVLAEVVSDLGLRPPGGDVVEAVLARVGGRRGHPPRVVRMRELYDDVVAHLQDDGAGSPL